MRGISALKLKKPATASLWYIGTNIFSRVSSFIFTPIFTRVLSPEEYSLYFLYLGWRGILSVITSLDLSGSVTFRALSDGRVDPSDYFRSAIILQGGFSLFFLILFFIFSDAITAFSSLPIPLFILMLFDIFFNFCEGIYFAKKRYSYDYKRVSLINIISGVASPIIALLFILLTPYKSEGRIFGAVSLSFAVAIPIIFTISRGGGKFSGIKTYKYILRLAMPLIPYSIFNSVSSNCDKIIISRILGKGALGEYSLGHSMGFLMNFLTMGISLAITPWIARKLSAGRCDIIKRTLGHTLFLISGCVLLYLCALPEIMSFVAPKSYLSSIRVVYPLSVGVIFSFSFGILSSILLQKNGGGRLIFSSFLGAVFAVGLGILFTLRFGYFGCGVAILLSVAIRFISLAASLREGVLDRRIFFLSALYLVSFALLIYSLSFSFISRVLVGMAVVLSVIPSLMRTKNLLFE